MCFVLVCGCQRPANFLSLLHENVLSSCTRDTNRLICKPPHLAGILSGSRSVVRHGSAVAVAVVVFTPPGQGDRIETARGTLVFL